MKKLLFAFPVVALLAAGCNSSQQASNQTPAQTPVAQNINPAPTPTPTPTPTMAPSPSPTPTTTTNKTLSIPSWQTYTNLELGFTVQYPNNWYYSVGNDMDPNYHVIAFLPNGKTMENKFPISLIVAKNTTEQSFVDQSMKINAPNTLTSSATTLAGQAATYYKIKPSSYPYTDNFVVTNKNASAYALQCHDIQGDPCDFTTFNKLVKSFQFTK